MINRMRTQSKYVFNSKTGMLEKMDNIENIPQKAQKNKKKQAEPVTSIMVITAEDNLIHNYFTSYETSWDASNCLQIATIKMPKMGQENINYWATYTGQLTVYMGYNFTYDKVNSNKHNTEQEAADSLARYWNNSKIKPYFRGEVDKIREYNNSITIYVKNIGARFKQKIPDEFRQAYIYNQPVRDSFQAICEFLGVQYICPPQTITDEAGEETQNTQPLNDGTENEVGNQVSTANNLANQARDKLSKTQNSNNNANNSSSTNGDDDKLAKNDENEEASDANGLDTEVNDIMNGYDDINFDANGAIVHASTVIETSPDISHTLVAMEEHPFERYLDDETGIVEKVQNFLDGEMFDELHNNVMNYDSITIQPKSTTTSDITSESGGLPGENQNGENNENSSSFDWAQMSAIVGKYFNRNNPNKNTIISAFRGCGDNWDCIAAKCNQYRQYRSTNNIDQIVREIRACFK